MRKIILTIFEIINCHSLQQAGDNFGSKDQHVLDKHKYNNFQSFNFSRIFKIDAYKNEE